MIKVRFAPSPTGFLHLGSARTALVNWLYARNTGGKFLLRIEDTDRERSDKKFLKEILEDLAWLGLDWDGDPVYQSDRFDLYRQKALGLLDEGKAYREGEALIFRVEKAQNIEIDDLIHGKITFNTDEIKDQVMIKSDGSPAYNFCCVVDDAELGITHIIRGDDHISNTPKQVLLYKAMGKELPRFAHMPLMMGADGAKLSKRHGAVAVEEYKNEGFLAEALANYLMLLGWTPGDGKEIMPIREAVKLFRIEDMSDVQARFDIQKLKWINGEYIMAMAVEKLSGILFSHLKEKGFDPTILAEETFKKLVGLYQVRIKTLGDFITLTDCFFTDSYAVEEKGAKKYLEPGKSKENLKLFAEKLDALNEFSAGNIEKVCRELAEEKSFKAADIIHPTRMAISGKTGGAGLFEIMEILGKEKVLERMRKAAG